MSSDREEDFLHLCCRVQLKHLLLPSLSRKWFLEGRARHVNMSGNGLRPRPIQFFDILSILNTARYPFDQPINMRDLVNEPDRTNIYNGEFDPGSG